MQYDDQQQNTETKKQNYNPHDLAQHAVRSPAHDWPDAMANRTPNGWQFSHQFQPTEEQERDLRRLQAHQSMGNLGGISNIFDDQFCQDDGSAQQAKDRPGQAFGRVDDIVADYTNRQADQSQRNQANQ
jgi:hypothetical protein